MPFTLPDLNVNTYAAGIVAALLVAAGWFGHSWYTDSNTLRIERATNAAVSAASKAAAEQIAGIKITNTVIHGKIIERVRTETVYQTCSHSPETFQLIQQAFK
mgnify:CR=1 FL=1